MKRTLITGLLLTTLTTSLLADDPLLPNPVLTPGATVTNSVEQITTPGYTKTVRNVPEKVKKQVFIQYFGFVPKNPGLYEIDHLISLELGGSNSISNLWPQSYITSPFNSHVKDKLENHLAALIRHDLETNGHEHATLLMKEIQQEISTNWTNAYHKYISLTP